MAAGGNRSLHWPQRSSVESPVDLFDHFELSSGDVHYLAEVATLLQAADQFDLARLEGAGIYQPDDAIEHRVWADRGGFCLALHPAVNEIGAQAERDEWRQQGRRNGESGG